MHYHMLETRNIQISGRHGKQLDSIIAQENLEDLDHHVNARQCTPHKHLGGLTDTELSIVHGRWPLSHVLQP